MVMDKTKENEVLEEVKEEVKEETSEESALYYFYSVGCGFCKKAEPLVDELIKEGHNILKLDLAEPDNVGLKNELSAKYGKQCGTPWFIDPETGNQVCGFRDKETVMKWIDGEDVPAPPRPKGPPPKVPFQNASKAEIIKWKEDYKKWCEENEHLPNLQPADKILERPRPKSDPPRPVSPNATDKQFEEWGKKYDKWAKENDHLPNLQPSEQIISRMQAQRDRIKPDSGKAITPELEARFQRIEQKLDKLVRHLGVN
jgi:thiol-disulfide isomerase/thioredoxin